MTLLFGLPRECALFGLFRRWPVDELLGGLLPDESFDNLLVPRRGAGQTIGCTALGDILSEILLMDAEYFPIDSLGVSTSISKSTTTGAGVKMFSMFNL